MPDACYKINLMNKTPIKITLLFTSSLTIMAGATIAPSLPQIQQVFIDNPHSEMLTKLILTIPALFIAIFSPIVGALIDRFGRIKIILSSLLLYGIAGSSGYFIEDLYILLVSRALLGIGVAGVMTSTITLIADYFKGSERNAFMGLQGAFVALGGVVSITLGGLLAEISWRTPFLIYFSSFIIFIPALIYLYEPEVRQDADSGKSKSLEPYPQILVALIYVTASIGMMLFYIIPVQIPFYIKEQTGASNTFIGLAIAASTVSSAIVSLNYKRIKAKFDYSMIYFFSFLFLGLGFVVIFYVTDYYLILLGLLIGGIGMGVLIPNSNVWIVSLSPESMRGRIVGGLTTSVFIGQFISPFLIQPVNSYTSTSGIFAFSGIGLILISLAYFGYTPLTKKSTRFQKFIKKRIF
jgi:MFS family permease